MRQRKSKPNFMIVSVDEARELTRREPEQLLRCYGVQTLTRRFADDRAEQALRVRVELLPRS